MDILIIEDEPLAAERLQDLILQYDSHLRVSATLDSVSASVAWLQEQPSPDLIFLDIHLADGLSFSIFDQVPINSPIIFTTAYDQYAIQAFKVNSVDYLLKPLDFEDVANALDKFAKLHLKPRQQNLLKGMDVVALRQAILGEQPQYKERFVVKKGEHLLSVPISEVLFFISEDKVTLLRTREGRRFVVDFTLGELEDKVNPRHFFRLNRQYLARHDAIADILSYSNRRLRVRLRDHDDDQILISRERIAEFKQWLDA